MNFFLSDVLSMPFTLTNEIAGGSRPVIGCYGAIRAYGFRVILLPENFDAKAFYF